MTRALAALVAVSVVGCGAPGGPTDAGANCPPGSDAGLGCGCGGETDGGCPGDLVCLPSDYGYPGGLCTAACGPDEPCPAGGICLPDDLASGTCLSPCAADAGCGRAGWACILAFGACLPAGSTAGPDPGGRGAGGEGCPAVAGGGGLGITWSRNELVGADSGYSQATTAIAAAGPVIAIGWDIVGSESGMGLAVSTDDGETFVTEPPLVDGTDAFQSDPALAADDGGRFYYAWTGFDRSAADPAVIAESRIWMAASSDARRWEPAVEIDDLGGGGGVDKPALAIEPVSRRPVAAYRAIVGGVEEIRASAGGPDGGSFSPSVRLDDGLRPSLGRNCAALAFDRLGHGWAAWVELGSADPNRDEDDIHGDPGNAVRTVAFGLDPDGGPVPAGSNGVASAAGAAVVQNCPGLAAAGDGSRLYLAYVAGTNEATDVFVTSSLDGARSWSPPVRVDADPGCATHFHPSLQLDGAGRVWVAWDENPGGVGRVAWSVSTDGAETFSVAGAISEAPFDFTTSRDAPGWLGDGLQILSAGRTSLLAAWTDPRPIDRGAPGWLAPSHVYFSAAILP